MAELGHEHIEVFDSIEKARGSPSSEVAGSPGLQSSNESSSNKESSSSVSAASECVATAAPPFSDVESESQQQPGRRRRTVSIEVEDQAAVSPEEQIRQLQEQVAQLEVDLEREQKVSSTLRSKLKFILWEYLPKQRSAVDIPAIDTKAVRVAEDGGVQLRDYELTSFVGAGHFGKVHLGLHRETKERVAVKMLDLEAQVQLEDMISLEQEIRSMKVLSHSNIVRLLDVLHGKDNLFLIMQYVPGGNLFDFLKQHHPVSIKVADSIFHGLVQAVAHMHQRGFTHRDIKPENLLLTVNQEPVLIDFGLCIKTAPGQATRSVAGTNGFMAPELFGSKPFLPQPTDVWSVGCTLLELLLGNHTTKSLENIDPSTAATQVSAVRASVSAEMAKQDRMTTTAADLVQLLLAVEPKKRPTAFKLMDWTLTEYGAQPTSPVQNLSPIQSGNAVKRRLNTRSSKTGTGRSGGREESPMHREAHEDEPSRESQASIDSRISSGGGDLQNNTLHPRSTGSPTHRGGQRVHEKSPATRRNGGPSFFASSPHSNTSSNPGNSLSSLRRATSFAEIRSFNRQRGQGSSTSSSSPALPSILHTQD